MFDKLKQMRDLKALQDKLKQQLVTVEREGVRVTMRGDFEITDLLLNQALDTDQQQEAVKRCINDAKQQIQVKIANSFQGQMPSL